MKKTGVQKSRETVPLTALEFFAEGEHEFKGTVQRAFTRFEIGLK
jgi:hypothetical protein